MSKVIVITGAGSGLGRELALSFSRRGDRVVLLGRTLGKLQAVAAELAGESLCVACNVSAPGDVRAAFAAIDERFGRIDVLINNAGIFVPSPVSEASDDYVVQTIATNLTGAILCAREATRRMEPGGYLINVSSESVDMPFPHMTIYQASKAGLERFGLSLHDELEDRGIRVTNVRAGAMGGENYIIAGDPQAYANFMIAAKARGLDFMIRPISTFASVTELFHTLVDLPADVHLAGLQVHARGTSAST